MMMMMMMMILMKMILDLKFYGKYNKNEGFREPQELAFEIYGMMMLLSNLEIVELGHLTLNLIIKFLAGLRKWIFHGYG